MNDTGTICHSNVVITCYEKSLLMLLVRNNLRAVVKRLILFALKICSFVCLKHFVCLLALFLRKRREHLVCKCLSKIVGVTICCFNLNISVIRVHTECHVTWKCPRRCCPCEEVSILSCNLEADDRRTLLNGLVSLRNLLGRKRSSTTRTVRYDLESLVQKLLVPDGLKCPPLRLDEIVIVCYIWVVHISPETNGS